MKSRIKKIIVIGIVCISLVLINYTPMMYNRKYGNPGTFVDFYYIHTSPRELLKKVDKELNAPNTPYLIKGKHNNFWYLTYFDKSDKKYYHFFFGAVTTASVTDVVFFGVSNDTVRGNTSRINEDFGVLMRQYNRTKFKKDALMKLLK